MKSLSLSTPHAIIMVGIPGSGKSFFAKKFSETFHAPLISQSDIENLGTSVQAVAELTHIFIHEIAKTHASMIIEAQTATRAERTELARVLKSSGYTPMFVWVQVDTETARQRFARSSSGTNDNFDQLLKRFSPPHQSEKAIVISGKHTYASQAKIILSRLSAPRIQAVSAPSAPLQRPGRITIR